MTSGVAPLEAQVEWIVLRRLRPEQPNRLKRLTDHAQYGNIKGTDESSLIMPALHQHAAIRAEIGRIEASRLADHRIMPVGVPDVDARLSGGGLRAGALHEVVAKTCWAVDDAAATLFLAGIAARDVRSSGGLVLWASTRHDLYAPGLEQAGLPSADVIHAQPRDDDALLAVVEDAVRDGTPSAVVAEVGRISMVATRRLQLAAAEADIPVLLLRRTRRNLQDPLAEPSAAWTRWRIGSAPSERLDPAMVGRPRWSVELARQRGGEPFSLILEGCDETGRLAVPAAPRHRATAPAGTVHRAAA